MQTQIGHAREFMTRVDFVLDLYVTLSQKSPQTHTAGVALVKPGANESQKNAKHVRNT